MITNDEQAFSIQAARYAAGKRGTAKAVRRYLQRTYPGNYKARRKSLLVTWPPKKPS